MPLPKFNFPTEPQLTGLCLAYGNAELVADQVLSQVSVDKQEFVYYEWDKETAFTLVDTTVGQKGEINEIESKGSRKTGSLDEHALAETVTAKAVQAAPDPMKPVERAILAVREVLAIDREQRTAGVVFNASNYTASLKTTLSGTSQLSDYTNSDPVALFEDALSSMPWTRANVAVMGQAVFDKLKRHPKLIKAVGRTQAADGILKAEEIASLFDLDRLIIGRSMLNLAKPGQTLNLGKIWGKHIALLYINPNFSLAGSPFPTWGFSARHSEGWLAGSLQKEPGEMGLRGGVKVWAGEMRGEKICAPELGYFIQNAVA